MSAQPATRDEWLAERRKGLGASDGVAVLGASQYHGPFGTWELKLGLKAEEETADPMALAGHRHEAGNAQWFADQRPDLTIDDPGDYAMFWADDSPVPMFCTPDRLAYVDGKLVAAVELKCAFGSVARKCKEGIPVPYQIQLQHQMYCLGVTEGYFVVETWAYDIFWRPMQIYWPFIERKMLPRYVEFWQHVTDRTEPIGVGAADTARMKDYWQPKPEKRIELDPSFHDVDRDLEQLKSEKGKIETKIAGLQNNLIAAVGDAECGTLGDVCYRWTKTGRSGRYLKRGENRE